MNPDPGLKACTKCRDVSPRIVQRIESSPRSPKTIWLVHQRFNRGPVPQNLGISPRYSREMARLCDQLQSMSSKNDHPSLSQVGLCTTRFNGPDFGVWRTRAVEPLSTSSVFTTYSVFDSEHLSR